MGEMVGTVGEGALIAIETSFSRCLGSGAARGRLVTASKTFDFDRAARAAPL
ncbi:hypothetical protein Rcae01_06064 [Novipirellula caenicola]|uniref:Uncharacterized protein n=1 Tax=Novipirellula caenicola TaxID=1536901 RepID=A0ABP9VZJ5_9BACT